MSRFLYLVFLFISMNCFGDSIQYVRTLTLEEVIYLAREQSIDAFIAKHNLHVSFSEYMTHKTSFRPNLTLSGTLPNYSRSYTDEYNHLDSSYVVIESNTNRSNLDLTLDQNVYPTGGTLRVSSMLSRLDNFNSNINSYTYTPLSISYFQPVFGYNQLQWDKTLEPLQYEIAQRKYVEAMLDVSITAIGYFFDLIDAKYSLEIAKVNNHNADTLFKVAQGRFNMGIIAENELLEMELSYLNSSIQVRESTFNFEYKQSQMRSYLGLNDNFQIQVEIPKDIPQIELEFADVHSKMVKNNPEYIEMEVDLLLAEQRIDRAKSEKGINADLMAGVGFARTSEQLTGTNSDLSNQQNISFGIRVPIIDWGVARTNYKLAIENAEIVEAQVNQAKIDFEQKLYIDVMRFNLLSSQLEVSNKAKEIAIKRYEIAKERYYAGNVNVTDLNIALNERDQAEMAYVFGIRDYWRAYYRIQKQTLYNYLQRKPLVEQIDLSFRKTF